MRTVPIAPMRLAELHHAIEVFVLERGDGERHVSALEWNFGEGGNFSVSVELESAQS